MLVITRLQSPCLAVGLRVWSEDSTKRKQDLFPLASSDATKNVLVHLHTSVSRRRKYAEGAHDDNDREPKPELDKDIAS